MRHFLLLAPLLAAMAACSNPPAARSVAEEQPAPRLSRMEETGRRMYLSVCAYCHGAAGDGFGLNATNLPVPPRDHTDSAYMKRLSDDQLFEVIKSGGAARGKSAFMPPWAGRFSDREITSLVRYLRTLGAAPGGRAPTTAR